MQVIFAVHPAPWKHVHTTRKRRARGAAQHENLEWIANVADDDHRRSRSNGLYGSYGLH
jgi:hypothetical protein